MIVVEYQVGAIDIERFRLIADAQGAIRFPTKSAKGQDYWHSKKASATWGKQGPWLVVVWKNEERDISETNVPHNECLCNSRSEISTVRRCCGRTSRFGELKPEPLRLRCSSRRNPGTSIEE